MTMMLLVKRDFLSQVNLSCQTELATVLLPFAGHLTGCGCADPHNSLTSASSGSSEHFPHKTGKKCLTFVIKQLLSILKNKKAEEIDYFEPVFLLKEAPNSFFGLPVYLLKSKFCIEGKLRFP